jgi:hypothetical protein
MMKKNSNTSKIFLLLVIIIVIVVLVFAWALPVWQADLSLDTQLYTRKAGVDFITVNLLNWSKLWAPLIPAAIVTGVLFYPRKFLGIFMKHSVQHRWRLAIMFSLLVFGAAYGICYLISDFAYGFFMASYLQNDPSYVNFFAAFSAMNIPFDPSTYNVEALLTWKYLTLPILDTILTAGLIRLGLEMFGARVNGGYAIEFLGRLFIVIGIILCFFYLASPLTSYDVIERIWLYILPLTMWTFFSIGSFGLLFTTFAPKQRDREEVAGATFIIAIIVVIGMIIGPCIGAAGDYFSRDLNYKQFVWDGKVQMQVSQTRYASGIDGFMKQNITSLISTTTNPQIVNKIRPFNQNSSMQMLETRITTPYETAHLPDIITLNNTEYWVAARDFYDGADAFGNAINEHVRYTSTQGFVAMDAHTGSIIEPSQYPSTFGVNYTYPLYFGEGYRNDLMLGIQDWPEITNASYPVDKADGTLSGYYTTVKVLGFSTDFITLANKDIAFLHRTNIEERVNGMLLPNMYMDSDPYLVFNDIDHMVYYCCPIYISIPGFTYFQSNYIRFLGWVLVDAHYGYMTFYKYDGLDTSSMPSYAKIYLGTGQGGLYPWQTIPNDQAGNHLKSQLRYPESVYEQQIAVDYTYHVTDWKVWHDNSNFYTQPSGGDTYFVMTDLGDGLELVAMNLVVPTSGTTTLAGMYLQRERYDHLGEVRFYKTISGQTLIGPETANQTFYNYHGIAQNLQLVPGRQTVNILLYGFANSLYYVVPVYSTQSSGLQTLNYVGLVNGFNTSQVYWGNTPEQAFAMITTTPTPPVTPPSISLTCTSPASVISPSLANISLLITNSNTNLVGSAVGITARLYVYSQNTTLRFNGSTITNVTNFGIDPANPSLGAGRIYSIGTWRLYPSQTRGFTIQMNASVGNFTTTTVPFRFVVSASSVTFNTTLRTIVFNYNIGGSQVILGLNIPTTVHGSTTTTLQLNVTNTNTIGSLKHVQVNLTLFAVLSPAMNATPQVPGMQSISNSTFTSDFFYTGHAGKNYTVIDVNLASQEFFGITMALNLPVTGSSFVYLFYRVSLTVDGIPAGNSMLRVIAWNRT